MLLQQAMIEQIRRGSIAWPNLVQRLHVNAGLSQRGNPRVALMKSRRISRPSAASPATGLDGVAQQSAANSDPPHPLLHRLPKSRVNAMARFLCRL